jgi:hypothetical protein
MSVTIVITHAKSLLPVILSSAACLDVPFFYIISQTVRFSGKIKLLNIKCVLIFPTNFVYNISHPEKNSARYYCNLT